MPPIGDEDEDRNVGALADDQDTPDNQDDADLDADDAPEGDDADEFDIVIDGEDAPEDADEPDLIKRLRAENKRQARELAEAKRAIPAPVVEKIDPGPKPTMDDCWEAEDPSAEFEKRLLAWHERVAEAKNAETAVEQAEAKKQEAFKADVARFAKHKTEMRAPDFDDAEAVVAATLTKEQASALLQATDNSAKVIYALGKRPDRLKALAAEPNIVKFIANVAKLEGAVKVSTTRRTAPEPDVPPRGSARLAPGVDKKLEALEREADRTGDRTKIRIYQRDLREKRDAARK